MRFLLDANLSPRLAGRLTDAGHDTVHVTDVGLLTASDSAIFDHADAEGWVVITADSDFSMLLAARRAATPSVVLLRHVAELRAQAHGDLLIANLPAVLHDLEQGAVVSLSPTRLSVRPLPITSDAAPRPDGS
jgi:predicted nuclease of predicted toxin-antitoxin system